MRRRVLELLVTLAWTAGVMAAPPFEFVWPKKDLVGGGILVRYKPEIEAWHGFAVLEVRMPVSFRRQGELRRVYGAIRVRAVTEVDRASGTVSLRDPWITEASFPTLGKDLTDQAVSWLQDNFPRADMVMPLDRLLHAMEDQRAMSFQVETSPRPPELFQAEGDSVLVLLDGDPVLEPIGGTGLEVVANTDAALFYLPGLDRFYLLHRDAWLSARSLGGPWGPAGEMPGAFRQLPAEGLWGQVRRSLPGRRLAPDQVPQVFVSRGEAELLQTRGRPQYQEIPGTGLMALTNSQADVFLDPRGGQRYLLLSGRWFRQPAGSRAPLEPVPDEALPDGLRELPATGPRAHVLASIPGTAQAEEAVMAAHIPRFKEVRRGQARYRASFLGAPVFQPIAGTEVEMATNTSEDVFRVRGRYYALDQGVWFEAAFATGPWSLADQIPREIYAIPPGHPKHHVAYTRVVASDEGQVLAGILPGYMGTFVSDGRVVHGVGRPVPRSPEFWRHALKRRLEWARQSELRADASGRPFHLEPFLRRSYGFQFQYDPTQALFQPQRPSSEGMAPEATPPPATTPPPPSRPRPPAVAAVAPASPAAMRVGADGTLYRGGRGGWERLSSGGWIPSDGPPSGSTGVRPGTMGRLPPNQGGSDGPGKSQVWPSPEAANEGGTAPAPVTLRGPGAPEIDSDHGKWRWSRTYGPPATLGFGRPTSYPPQYGGYYGYYGPVYQSFSSGVVGPTATSGAGPTGYTGVVRDTGISPLNMPATYRDPRAGRPSLQPIIKTGQ